MRCSRFFAAILALLPLASDAAAAAAGAATVSVGAASNFSPALEALHAAFRRAAPEVVLRSSIASSGSLFTQIRNGAPFDVFLSADTDYPRQLVTVGAGEAATLRIFACGRLAIWTTRPKLDVADLTGLIRSSAVKRIAIAQPATAPYGRAAQAALEHIGVWRLAQPKLVFGETIAQTAQFVETGNADVGLIAMSLVLAPQLANRGRWQEVPPAWYAGVSLDHGAVLTRRGAANPAAQRYLEFLGSEAAQKVLRDFGYIPGQAK